MFIEDDIEPAAVNRCV